MLNLPLDSMFLFTRGSEPRRARKDELSQDNAYRALTRPREDAEAGIGKERVR